MGKHPDEEHAADLVRKVHDAIHEHTVVDRDVADVAREILDEGPSP